MIDALDDVETSPSKASAPTPDERTERSYEQRERMSTYRHE